MVLGSMYNQEVVCATVSQQLDSVVLRIHTPAYLTCWM